jgi:hypothetical protein
MFLTHIFKILDPLSLNIKLQHYIIFLFINYKEGMTQIIDFKKKLFNDLSRLLNPNL